MKREYQIVGGKERGRFSAKEAKEVRAFFAANGQALLPLVELIEASKLAVDELIEVAGKTVIETVLRMSVEHLIGPPHPGKPGAEIVRYGRQPGMVLLSNRKLKVERPRLRRKGAGRRGKEGQSPFFGIFQSYLIIKMDGLCPKKIILSIATACFIQKKGDCPSFQPIGYLP